MRAFADRGQGSAMEAMAERLRRELVPWGMYAAWVALALTGGWIVCSAVLGLEASAVTVYRASPLLYRLMRRASRHWP